MYTQKTVLLGRPVYSAVDVFRPETRDRLSRDAGLLRCLLARPIVLVGILQFLLAFAALLWGWGSENRYKAALVYFAVYHKRQWHGGRSR